MNPHKIAFVLASTNYGMMIVNRMDKHARQLNADEGGGVLVYGVSTELMERAEYSENEVDAGRNLLELLRKTRPGEIHAIDGGAHIGTHTIAWADYMRGWGRVTAFEPQRMIFYALCGNVAVNNLPNVLTMNAALGSQTGSIVVPDVNYGELGSYGSLEIKPTKGENIGQDIDYDNGYPVPLLALDGMPSRLDFLKLDIEGMELEVLQGAEAIIERDRPVMMIEWIKVGLEPLTEWLTSRDYDVMVFGRHNVLAIHRDDPVREHVGLEPPEKEAKEC